MAVITRSTGRIRQVIVIVSRDVLYPTDYTTMKYKDLIILLPCHSLEDFPTHHEGEEAAGLLAGWSALWHPALIASAGSMPSWFRVDSPPDELAERLLIVPGVSEAELPIGFTQRSKDSGACLIRNKTDRQEILETALSRLDPADTEVDPDLAADFLALGYCYLQIELLTRQMRYSSNLDEIHFQNQLIDAAKAAMQGDLEMARDRLTSCFDVLAEERDHYYPVDACIMDLTMLASTTLGASLRKQLDSELPTNLLMTAQLLDEMSQREPETLTSLRLAVE
jgi:alpha-mannosidase